MHPLIADGGELTVLRSLAAFAYGSWSVSWPESVPDDLRPTLLDDRDFGFAARLKSTDGRMARRFVRADVSIQAAELTDSGTPIALTGFSDVEQVLDDAASRTDGDAFFERSIDRSGLGSLIPRVDFDVDDIVPVSIWGRVLSAPVTLIEDVVELGRVVDWRVQVGGTLIVDDDARERQIRELSRDILAERRDREATVGQAARDAASARREASAAREAAETALAAAGGDAVLLEQYIEEARTAALSASDFAAQAIAAADEADALNVGMAAKLSTVAGYVQDAAGHVADARLSAEQAHGYLADGREILAQTDALKIAADNAATAASEHADDALLAASESRQLTLQNQQSVGQISRYASTIAGLVGNASASAAQAFAYLDESRVLRESTRVFMEQAEDAVESAQGYVSQAGQIMDEADLVLESGKQFRDQAQSAKTGAETALVQAKGTLEQVVTKHGEVLTWHQEMLAAHDETLSTHELVLKLHASGIRAANAAAGQAASAAAANSMVLQVHGQILELHEDAIAAATQTALDASKAAGEAGKAIAAQREIEKQQILIDQKQDDAIASAAQSGKDAAAAAAAVKEITTMHGEILKDQDAAIAAATKTGQDAAAAAKDAGDAAKAVAAAQEIQVEINTRLAAGVRAAGVAAAQAAAATSSLALAVEEVDKAAAFAQQTADDAKAVGEKATQIANDAKTASDAAIAAGNARDQTIKDVSLMTWVAQFQTVRQVMYEVNAPYVEADRQLTSTIVFRDRSQLGILRVVKVSSGWEIRFTKIGTWAGDVEVNVMYSDLRFGGFTRRWDFEDTSEHVLTMSNSELWQRIFIKVYPYYPDVQTMVNFQNTAAKYRALM